MCSSSRKFSFCLFYFVDNQFIRRFLLSKVTILSTILCWQISKQAPDIAQSIEREGHTHAFCCTQAGSLWVADYVANLIKNKTSSSSQ